MRWINKTSEPRELREWRARYAGDVNFNYNLIRQDHNVTQALTASLLREQGHLCAYTGRGINDDRCHIEHVTPQKHCERGEDVAYTNMVACYPAPNAGRGLYGAHQKDDWPSPEERHMFVSPLDRTCETRFIFNLRGEIRSKPNDDAAKETVKKLKLKHPELEALRKGAIRGTLGQTNNLRLKAARKRLRELETPRDDYLAPFCFVLIQALRKHIHRLECIAQSKRKRK